MKQESSGGGIFSVALSFPSQGAVISGHPSRRSPDFPPPLLAVLPPALLRKAKQGGMKQESSGGNHLAYFKMATLAK